MLSEPDFEALKMIMRGGGGGAMYPSLDPPLYDGLIDGRKLIIIFLSVCSNFLYSEVRKYLVFNVFCCTSTLNYILLFPILVFM